MTALLLWVYCTIIDFHGTMDRTISGNGLPSRSFRSRGGKVQTHMKFSQYSQGDLGGEGGGVADIIISARACQEQPSITEQNPPPQTFSPVPHPWQFHMVSEIWSQPQNRCWHCDGCPRRRSIVVNEGMFGIHSINVSCWNMLTSQGLMKGYSDWLTLCEQPSFPVLFNT